MKYIEKKNKHKLRETTCQFKKLQLSVFEA